MQIVYEPHPVSPERKAELRAAGVKILDAQFKPADYEEAAPPVEDAPAIAAPKRGRPRKAD